MCCKEEACIYCVLYAALCLVISSCMTELHSQVLLFLFMTGCEKSVILWSTKSNGLCFALIRICSLLKWHFKEPTNSVAHNATECKMLFWLFQDLSFSPLSHHPTSIVTAVWQTVSKHHICCVLLCGVNNTESSTRPQSINHDGGTSNTTAAAIFITKTCTQRLLLQPTSLPHTPLWFHLQSAWVVLFLHGYHCNHNYICICKYAHNSTLFSTLLCQLQYQAQAQNTHNFPCVQCLFLHMTAAVVCYCMRNLSNVKRILTLWQWVKHPWVEENSILYPA